MYASMLTCGGDERAVRRKRGRTFPTREVVDIDGRRNGRNRVPGARVPHVGAPITTDRVDVPAVGCKPKPVDWQIVVRQDPDRRAAITPEPDDTVATGGGDQFRMRADGED